MDIGLHLLLTWTALENIDAVLLNKLKLHRPFKVLLILIVIYLSLGWNNKLIFLHDRSF